MHAKNLTEGEIVNTECIVYDKDGWRLPYNAFLNRDGEDYVFTIGQDKAFPKRVKIVASGKEGVVVEENLSNEKVALAKPDILLKLLYGNKVIPKGN